MFCSKKKKSYIVFQCHQCIEITMRTNETTCIISGLKVDVVLINQECASNALISQFDSVQVINNNNNENVIIFSFLKNKFIYLFILFIVIYVFRNFHLNQN